MTDLNSRSKMNWRSDTVWRQKIVRVYNFQFYDRHPEKIFFKDGRRRKKSR